MTHDLPVPSFSTSLGVSDADTITLLGQDLAADLMGKVGFAEPGHVARHAGAANAGAGQGV